MQLAPAAVSADIVNDDLFADIAVTNTRQPGSTVPGQTVSYQVIVQNLSSVISVPTTAFTYTLGAQLGSVFGSCIPSGGAVCPPGGAGAPAHNISLPANSSVSYTITALILAGTPIGDTVTTTASATVQSPYSDPNNANNTASAQFVVGGDALFSNGFE